MADSPENPASGSKTKYAPLKNHPHGQRPATMRTFISICLLALISFNPAFANSRPSHKEEARCIAVFDVASSLLEEDGTVPDKVSAIKEFSRRMSLRLALDSTVKEAKGFARIQSKEQDRLYARVNAAATDEETDSVYDSIFQDVETCKNLLPAPISTP